MEVDEMDLLGAKQKSLLDDICDLHKDSDWGGKKEKGKLLDWRNNEDDNDSLCWYLSRLISFEMEPCRICGEPRHLCAQVDHYDFVFEEGIMIGGSERLVEICSIDDNGHSFVKDALYDMDTLSLSNVDKMEKV